MNETHLNEEDLILHHYGEGSGPAGAEAHLAGCPACAAAFLELRRLLALVPADTAPDRGADYGGRVFAQLRGWQVCLRQRVVFSVTLNDECLHGVSFSHNG